MRRALFVALLFPLTAHADDFTDMVKAREFSEIIAASDVCGYGIEQTAADRFIREELVNMPEMTRMGFQTAGMAITSEIDTATATQKATTCTRLHALGEKHGLVK